MMPFLADGSSKPSVTITSSNGSATASDIVRKFLKQEHSSQSFSESSSGAKLHRVERHSYSSPSTVAEFQRKAALRKLQMAKMMGHGGGMSSQSLDFRKLQGHTLSQGHMMSDYHNDSLQGAAARRARSNNFTLNETFALLKIWASPEMQWQMKHNFRNFRVWEAISFAMQELGHDRTAIQCKNRIQNLTSIFYRIKKSKQDYRSFNFPYYKIIGDVLDGKKNGSNATMPPNMAEFLQHFTNNGVGVIVSPTHSSSGGTGSSGMAAHMALVEEYQHLINGNPEVTLTPTGDRHSPSNGMSGVLSPEVSLSEGDSPIRMNSQSRSHAQKSHAGSNASSMAQRNAATNGSAADSTSGVRSDQEDGTGGMLDDGSIPSENDHETSDVDESALYPEEEALALLGRAESFANGRMKRSLPSSFPSFGKSSFGNGMPSKRSRGLSSATTASTSVLEDPVGQYLSEMVEIERQWLDMERERAENERQMMMYMMQILQALVCPGQEQEDEEEGVMENNENEESQENEYGEQEQDTENEMLEQEETMEESA